VKKWILPIGTLVRLNRERRIKYPKIWFRYGYGQIEMEMVIPSEKFVGRITSFDTTLNEYRVCWIADQRESGNYFWSETAMEIIAEPIFNPSKRNYSCQQ
jgi:hypothetical protein